MALSEEKVLCARTGDVLVIDPNKIIIDDHTTASKRVEDRYVPQEDLVMYAGLKAFRKGRSSVSEASDGVASSVDFGEIMVNFLNPLKDNENGKGYFTSQWTDVFTDQRSAETVLDPETFGIKSIEITQNASLVPRIVVEFTDVRGKTLMERGDDANNPYNLFYSLPYPSFVLTLKGYYGKAITYPLVLLKTNTRFDPASGDYHIRCEFLSRTFAIFNDFLLIYGMVAPFMFKLPENKVVDGVEYQGMYILKQLYEMQNVQIEADLRADKTLKKANWTDNQYEAFIQAELARKTIEKPITIYDLIKAAESLKSNDFTQTDNPEAQEAIDARTVIDSFKFDMDTALEYITQFFTSGYVDDLEYKNGNYEFLDKTQNVSSIPNITATCEQINQTYEKYLGKTDNKHIKELDIQIKQELRTKGLVAKGGAIISPEMFETIEPKTRQYQLTTEKYNNIFKIVDAKIQSVYNNLDEKVVDSQRENIKKRLGFDVTMENVVRIFMNNMQTFLMLLNLTTRKAKQQIKNDNNRKSAQGQDGETFNKDGVTQMFPWPNFYTVDKDRQKENQEVYKRSYPGAKTGNKIWPEVQFVEEIYKSLERLKVLSGEKQPDQLITTALLSPFLNVVSNEQYTTIDQKAPAVEMIKKSVISLLHDGWLFKNLKETELDTVAQVLTNYDYTVLSNKAKQLPGSKTYNPLKYVSDNFLTAYEDLKSKFRSVVDLNKLAVKIKAENDLFAPNDDVKYKQFVAATKNADVNKFLTKSNDVTIAVYNELSKVSDPISYTNPGVIESARQVGFGADTAAKNNRYQVAPFPGFSEKYGTGTTQNPTLGYYKQLTETFNEVIYGKENVVINGAKALTANNNTSSDETTAVVNLAARYNRY